MSNLQAETSPIQDEAEIGLQDVVNALRLTYHWILAGAFVTPLLVAGGTQIFGQYTAESTLSNTCIPETLENRDKDDKDNKNKEKSLAKGPECALTFVRWRMLAENLPGVAGQWAQVPKRSDAPMALSWLAASSWWEKAVVPVYAISQAEVKKFPQMDERLKAETTRISRLKVMTTDGKSQRAEEGLDASLRFLRNAATYIELKNLLDGYRSEIEFRRSQFEGERMGAEVEAGYQRARLKELEAMRGKDQEVAIRDDVRVDVGTVEPSYLPLRTQVNALKVTLYGLEEKIRRLADQAEAMNGIEAFLDQAKPFLGAPYGGQDAESLVRPLLEIVDQLSSQSSKDQLPRLEALARIRGEVSHLQGRYGTELPELSRRTDPPRVSLQVLAASCFGGAFLGFILAFGRHKLREYYPADKRI